MKSTSILLVDDQPTVLAALENAIHAFFPHVQILLTTSADEAWELLRQHRPDIVLSDVVMPTGMSGLELCEHIKADPTLASTYVILMTAFSSQEWTSSIQRRADAFLRKPFQLLELRDKLEAAFRVIELSRSRLHQSREEVNSRQTELNAFLIALLCLRSPSLAELAENLNKAAQWLCQHVEGLSEAERAASPRLGSAYVLGRLTLPDSLLHEPLTRNGYLSHELMVQVPLGAATVCRHHPQLAPLAPILSSLAENWDGSGFPEHRRAWDIPFSSRLFRLIVDFEELLWISPQPPPLVAAHLERYARQAYDVQLLPFISQYAAVRETRSDVLAVGLHELHEGMVLAHDIQTRTGLKLATAGTVLTQRLVERLLRHHANDPIVGLILVRRSAEGSP